MGLLTPFLMIIELLFQELWTRGLDWDQPLDADIANSWETWKHELANVDQIKVPRWLLRNLSSVDKVQLHGFGDASERAYWTEVYICAEDKDGNRISNLRYGQVKSSTGETNQFAKTGASCSIHHS